MAQEIGARQQILLELKTFAVGFLALVPLYAAMDGLLSFFPAVPARVQHLIGAALCAPIAAWVIWAIRRRMT